MVGFRKSMAPVHTWGGLVVGWFLYFIFFTGTLGYFDTEIDRWTRPEIPVQSVNAVDAVGIAQTYLNKTAPNAGTWTIGLPGHRDFPNLTVLWRYQQPSEQRPAGGRKRLDDNTLQPYEARDTFGGQTLYRMHYNLHYMPRIAGRYLVGLFTMFMLLAMITGIVIHKNIFKDFFTFRPKKGTRSWLDAHNALSVLALPYHLMITYSGLLFFVALYMPIILVATYGTGEDAQQQLIADVFPRVAYQSAGEPAQLADLQPMVAQAETHWGASQVKSMFIHYPGDAAARVEVNRYADSPLRGNDVLLFDGVSGELIEDRVNAARPSVATFLVFLGLHEAHFAGPLLRWLFFLSGVMGTVMVASGLILWSVKRYENQQRRKCSPRKAYAFVESLNIGSLVGLPVAVAAFFWANRLLPVEMANRAEWEMHALFLCWMGMLLYAFIRPKRKAWVESLWIAAFAYLSIPFISAMTTQRHFVHSMREADWVYVGAELVFFVTGIVFAAVGWYLHRRGYAMAEVDAERSIKNNNDNDTITVAGKRI